MRRRHVAKRRLSLDTYEVVIVVDSEERTRRIGDLPHHDRGDFHGIAICVIHLEVTCLEVPDPNAYVAVLGEGPDPREAGLVHRADVAAEELHHSGLAWLHDDQRAHHHDGDARCRIAVEPLG